MTGRAALDLHQLAGDVREIPRTGLIAAVKLVKNIAREEATAAGSPMQGKKKRPMRLRVKDFERPNRGGVAFLIQGVPAAGWVWVETGTAAHSIRRRKKGPMRKMTVHHPGTRGRGAWGAVVDRSTRLVPELFAEQVREVTRRG